MDSERQEEEREPWYPNVRSFLEREYPTIRALSAIAVGVTAVGACISIIIFARQVSIEAAKPALAGQFFTQTLPREGLQDIGDEMVNELISGIIELAANDEAPNYADLMAELLPISRNIPPSPQELIARVENSGTKGANNVSLSLRWVGQITSFDGQAMSEWEIIDGGIGRDSITFRFERVSPGEVIEAIVTYAPTQDAIDTLELTMLGGRSSYLAFMGYWDSVYFPSFAVHPSESTPSFQQADVRVASDETPLRELEQASTDEIYLFFESMIDNRVE